MASDRTLQAMTAYDRKDFQGTAVDYNLPQFTEWVHSPFKQPSNCKSVSIDSQSVRFCLFGHANCSKVSREVVDNGIGFDEQYVDRIFQVFQRLHGKTRYVGTGIGLAICAKVVANHGGAITAHSQVGQGATFWVYLPVIEG